MNQAIAYCVALRAVGTIERSLAALALATVSGLPKAAAYLYVSGAVAANQLNLIPAEYYWLFNPFAVILGLWTLSNPR